MVKLSALEATVAYKAWIAENIKNVDSERNSSGKFLFSVASGSIGVFVGLLKLSGVKRLQVNEWVSLGCFSFSALLAILIFVPPAIDLSLNHNLQTKHEEMVKRIRLLTVLWFIIWIVGVFAGGIALSVLPDLPTSQ